MSLADLSDINKWLPTDKISVSEAEDDEFQLTVERSIKGLLANLYTAVTLSSWGTPSTTPGEIREIAGKLIAALFYRKKFSGQTTELAAYAQQLYNEAYEALMQIRSGDLVLIDLPAGTTVTIADAFTNLDFLPNDSTGPPKFTMDMEFA